MFESAELGHKIDKETFKIEVPKLRAALLDVQDDLLQKKEFPVVILISGVDGSGKGETINLLYSWMDPRHISTLAFSAPSDEERSRPYMWRYWRALPPKGKVGIFAGSWYSHPIADRIAGNMRRSEMDQQLDDINRFEAMLVNEGALVLKFWFHLSKEGQKTRLKALEKDPRTAWRVTKQSYERAISTEVFPCATSSSTNGVDTFPSGRTGTERESSGFLHTMIFNVSPAPTT